MRRANFSYKELLGWSSSTPVLNTGIYEVTPTELPEGSPGLRIAPPGASDTFYFEFRQPLGFDSVLFDNQVYTGSLAHLGGNPAFILNMDPSNSPPYGPTTPALSPGEKYIDFASRFSVTPISTSPAGMQLRILVPGTNSPASLFVNPLDGSIMSGAATISVDALDRSGITKVELYGNGSLIGTPNPILNEGNTAGSAQYYVFAWDTATVPSGSHTLTALAYNATNTSTSTSINVTVRKPPQVMIVSPSDQSQLTDVASINLIANVTADHAGVNSVAFFANGNSLGAGAPASSGAYSFTWTNVPAGTYSITASTTDTNNLASTSAPVTISVHNPLVAAGGVLGAAGSTPGGSIAPGSLISIYGTDLAGSPAGASSVPLPDQLSGVSVTLNGIAAPLSYVSAKQINAQAPWELLNASGSATLVVTRSGVASPPQAVTVVSATPAIFTLASPAGQAVAVNPDGSIAAPLNSIAGGAAHPAKRGDTIVVYATGLGEVMPSIGDGTSSVGTLRRTVTKPLVMLGGVSCAVEFSGLSPQFVGVNQLNITIPTNAPAGDAVPLQIQMGGVSSSSAVTIAVGH